ncbi:MAG TPA: hypothetical protein DCP90_09150 [Clostridiales bacterium]|nr:MAG: hypothetical protein A2Y22_02910 [Clostridiales bacterium GWD2_32_59]HAN10759.1 hypothetical protein [Clostridiales bacterium]
MYNRAKTYVLAILIIIAICQMVELWFDDYSSRNFFYSVITNIFTKNNTDVNYKYQLEPIMLVVSFGKQYTVLKDTDEVTKNFDAELKRIFNFINTEDLDITEETINMKEFLDNQAVLYQYPVQLSSIKSLNNDYDENNKNIKLIGEFSKIILQPSILGDGSVICFFIDEHNKTMKKVKVEYNSKTIADDINFIQYKTVFKKYSVPEYVGLKNFSDINFLPEFLKSDIYTKLNVIMKNPFKTNDVIDDKKVEEYVNSFFENPSAKWRSEKQNGITVYSDGEKSVRFSDAGLMEYTNSKFSEKYAYLSFEAAYQLAMAFIEKDNKYIYPDLYLVNAKRNSDSEWKLSFEFKTDDYRYVMANNLEKDIILKYPVEVIVKNNRVHSYKRLIREYGLSPTFEKIRLKRYNKVIDDKLKENKNIIIKNMFLSYYSEDLEQNPKLVWIIETADNVYPIDAIDNDEEKWS